MKTKAALYDRRSAILSPIFAIFCSMAFMISGCVSSKQYYEQVGLSREAAYRQWKSSKDSQEQSQTVINGKLSIKDCLKLTLANNKALQIILEEREIARGERLKSYSAILPSVNVTGRWQEIDEVASLSFGGTKITLGDIHSYSTNLNVTQPIFAGGQITAQLQSAKLFSLITDQTVRAAVQDTIYAAEHAYYDVLLSQHLVEISADAVRSSKAHLESVKQKRDGGVASDFDVLRAEVELSNFEAELIKNRNAIDIAKAGLIKVMGVSQNSDFVLSDELVYASLKVTMDEAVEAAYRNRPDLLGREFDIRLQKESLKAIRSRYFPTISAYYDNIFSKPDPHNQMEMEWGHMWQAGFTATLPIFDGFSREGEIIQQKARIKQAQVDLIDTEETALFELTKAQLSIENAVEFVESQRLNLQRAKEGLRLAEVGYREGTNTQVEMIDAQAAVTTARANYYQAIYSHIIAKLDLQKAMGTFAMVGQNLPVVASD
jgi:outer membrane protein